MTQATKEVAMFKNTVISKGTIVALALAATSATSVFAAGPTKSSPASAQAATAILQNDWKFDTSIFKFESAVFNRVDGLLDGNARRHPDVDTSGREGKERTRAFVTVNMILNKAQALITNHAGFDATNQVTDQTQAQKTVQQLTIYLNELRSGLMDRLENLIS
jgi:hypothetical protein